MLKKILLAIIGIVLAAVVGLAGFAWWSLQPTVNPLELPEELISLSDPRGQILLQNADAKSDYALLSENFESQELRSFCGVASGVTVLNSLGKNLDQSSFFDADEANMKSRFDVMFSGMTLAEFAAFLMAHGSITNTQYADVLRVDEFREIVRENLIEPENYIVVNYQREVLGQRRVGHISPIGAYDDKTDSVLILDTASYNYPPTWVPLAQLYSAMTTVDPASGKTRGFIEVSCAR